jgi:hypothetical protein
MKNFKFILFIALFLGVITSCTIEKRQHFSGYHINWDTYSKKKSAAAQVQKAPQIEVLPINKHAIQNALELEHVRIIPITTPKEAVMIPPSKNVRKVKKEIFKDKASDSCDVLTFKNGNEVNVKVLEINARQVKYRYCNPNGNTIITEEKSNIFSVKYSNGSKEIFNKSGGQASNSGNIFGDEGKSQIIALILCIFLGGIGIHRFYLGYNKIGFLFLLTSIFFLFSYFLSLLGLILFLIPALLLPIILFGIWLIDLIRILTGGLKPVNGDYTEKL